MISALTGIVIKVAKSIIEATFRLLNKFFAIFVFYLIVQILFCLHYTKDTPSNQSSIDTNLILTGFTAIIASTMVL